MIPKRLTLNDLEWLFRVIFCFLEPVCLTYEYDRATFENNWVETNKDTAIGHDANLQRGL